MTCIACGHDNRAGRKFCGGCGAALLGDVDAALARFHELCAARRAT